MTSTDDARGSDLIPVFETSDITLLAVVKSMMEDAGVPFVIQGEHALEVLPLGPFGAGIRKHGVGAILHVPPDRAEEAKALLASLPSD
jgi:hypothetical protein